MESIKVGDKTWIFDSDSYQKTSRWYLSRERLFWLLHYNNYSESEALDIIDEEFPEFIGI